MKNLITLGFLLTTMLFFPGCYTILLIEPTNEDVSCNWDPIPDFPEPWPMPSPPPEPRPPRPHPPLPPSPSPIHVIVVNNPPSTSPIINDRRLIHTGRGPLNANLPPARNDDNKREIRDSGVQKSGYAESNPAPVKNDENNSGIRNSGGQRGRR